MYFRLIFNKFVPRDQQAKLIAKCMAKWLSTFKQQYRKLPTVRDLLAWTSFVVQNEDIGCLPHKIQHGAMKAIGDGLPVHLQKIAEKEVELLIWESLQFECKCADVEAGKVVISPDNFGIFPFFLNVQGKLYFFEKH